MSSTEPMWQLLVTEPASLTCEQCFTVIEYFFETLGDDHDVLFPIIEAYLERCPDCVIKQHLIRYRTLADEGRTEDTREPVG